MSIISNKKLKENTDSSKNRAYPFLDLTHDPKKYSANIVIVLDVSTKFHQNRNNGSSVIASQTDTHTYIQTSRQTICKSSSYKTQSSDSTSFCQMCFVTSLGNSLFRMTSNFTVGRRRLIMIL